VDATALAVKESTRPVPGGAQTSGDILPEHDRVACHGFFCGRRVDRMAPEFLATIYSMGGENAILFWFWSLQGQSPLVPEQRINV